MTPRAPEDRALAAADFFIRYYLLGTLGFALFDLVFHASLRASFLGDGRARMIYYAVAFALGLLCRRVPLWAPVIGLIESATNIFLLILSILLPIWNLVDQAETGPLTLPFTPWTFVNFAISGSILVLAYYRNPIVRGAPARGAGKGSRP